MPHTDSKVVTLVHGATGADDVPGLSAIEDHAELRFTNDPSTLKRMLADAEVVLGWDFSAGTLRDAWDHAGSLRWIHWAGAGVDAVLFPELAQSQVILTNSRGIFDRPMAEYVLGLIIAFAKRLPETFAFQAKREWQHRVSQRMEGQQVLIVGVGSIGRETARLLTRFGLQVQGVGRQTRDGDPDFGQVHAVGELDSLLPDVDYVVLVTPLTAETRDMFGASRFRLMKPTARFINIGRGALVDEAALIGELERGTIAGAALDVFRDEPLPAHSPLWSLPNVIVSPHMSGDFAGYPETVSGLFLDNFRRYRAGEALLNVVDKTLGFVARG